MATEKKTKRKAAMREVLVYLASRNSTGIHEVVLRVDSSDRVHGDRDSEFLPWGYLSDVGKSNDWRTAHCFFTHAEARTDYIAGIFRAQYTPDPKVHAESVSCHVVPRAIPDR